MKRASPHSSPGNLRAFIACLLSFTMLITPLAAIAGSGPVTISTSGKSDAEKSNQPRSSEEELFVNPPTAMPGPVAAPLPAPVPPPPGSVTATLTGQLLPADDVNSDGNVDPGDKITYTATLGNTTGLDATGVSFSDSIDSHTTVSGSVQSTPVAFDQSFPAFDEDPVSPVTITLSGQDPDGSNLTAFTIITPPTKGTLGTVSSPPACASSGVCTATVTYAPNLNSNGSDSFTFKVNDGTALSNEVGTVSITVNAVNDAPTLTVPSAQTTAEDTALLFNTAGANRIRVADVDAGGALTFSVKFTAAHGLIFAPTTGVSVSNNNSKIVTVTGTVAAIDTAINGVTYTPDLNYNGADPLLVHADDAGNTGSPGAQTADASVGITITPVNDTPTAVDKNEGSVQANMKISIGAGTNASQSGLLVGVADIDSGDTGFTSVLTVGSIGASVPIAGVITANIAGVGNVVANANDGSFTFDPEAGVLGNVSFNYTVCDNGRPTPSACSVSHSVTFNVIGPTVWFVNPGGVSVGDGRLSNPFNNFGTAAGKLASLNANQRIFVYSGNTTTNAPGAGVTLQGGASQAVSEWLIGQNATDSGGTTNFDTFMGFSPPSGTMARPSIGPGFTKPTINGRVQMNGSNTRVQGINITPPSGTQGLTATNGSAPGAGTALTGLQLGASPTSDVIVSTTGASGSNAMGVSLTNVSGNFNFISVTTNGGLGISADTIGSGSTMNFGPVSISNRSGTGVFINNAQGTITFGATTIPNPADAGGYGIRIDNSSATVTIPTATISDPHTVTAQTDPDTDLIPNTDGDGDAIFLKNNTGSFTLSGGTLSNCGNDCIDGRTVQTLTLTDVAINTPGQETGGQGAGGHGISLIDLSGTSNLTGLLITQFLRSQVDGFRAINTNKNATVNVINSRFENSAAAGAADGNDGLFFEGRGTSSMTLVVDEVAPTATKFSRFQGLFGDGIQISTGAVSSGKMTTTVKNTDFKDAYQGLTQTGSGNNGLRIAGVGGGKHAVDIQNNTFLNVNKPLFAQGVISLFINDNSEVKGTIAGNTITNATQAGIQVFADNAAGQTITDMDLIIQNNTLDNISSQGIIVQMTVTGGTLAGCDFRILNNNIGQTTPVGDGEVMFGFPGGFTSSAEGILFSTRGTPKTCNLKVANNNVKINANGVNAGFPPSNEVLQLSVSESATLNATVQNNQLLQLDDIANGAAFFGQSFGAGTPNVCLDFTGNTGNTNVDFFLQKAAGGSFVIENVANVVAANTGVWSPANPSASGYANSAGCTEPPVGITQLWVPDKGQKGQKDYLAARPETAFQNSGAESLVAFLNTRTGFASIFGSFPGSFHRDTQSAPAVLPAGNPQSAPIRGSGNSTNAWTLFIQASAAFDMARADLNHALVEQASSSTTKAHPQSDIAPSSLQATVNGARAVKPSAEKEVRNQQSAVSSRGEVKLNHARSRSIPPSNAAAVMPLVSPPPGPGTFPVNGTGSGFKLPSDGVHTHTVTITFKVLVTNPPNFSGVPPAAPQVSNHGTLSGTLLPSTPFSIDTSTITTAVDLFDTNTTLSSTPATWNSGQSITLDAAVAPNPANATPVGGSVTFYDGAIAPANIISGCGSASVTSGAAHCSIASIALGLHNFNARYNGDGNFDPSNSNTFSQTANKTNTSTAVVGVPSSSLVTQSVTFTATVTPAAGGFAGPPTGLITFKDNGSTITCSGGNQNLSGGQATCQYSGMAATGAQHDITALYPGDGNFNSSDNIAAPFKQTVDKSGTTTALASSANPVAPGVEVTYTATVTSLTSVSPPTGTVTFTDSVSGVIGCTNPVGEQTLNGSGVATCKFTYADTLGSPHLITAQFNGDLTFSPSASSPALSETVASCSASVVVTSPLDDGGTGTLRYAIDTGVCADGAITFAPAVTSITLATGELLIGKNMTITGLGASTLTVSAGDAFRVFHVSPGKTATISDLTITGGKVIGTAGGAGAAGDPAVGGGVYNEGTLMLLNTIVSGNHVTGGAGGDAIGSPGGAGGDGKGGGVFSSGTLTLTNTTVNGTNSATGGKGGDSDFPNGNGGAGQGGGVYGFGTVALNNSTISSNTATGGAPGAGSGAAGTTGSGLGGGIYNDGVSGSATAMITGSTINGNIASLNGGGIFNISTGDNATLTLINSTVSGNKANNDGGGVYNASGTGTTTFTSVTVTGNSADNDDNASGAGGGINVFNGTFNLQNTIVAGNLKGSAVLQVETATVAGAITADGFAKVIVTAAGMTDSPKTVSVPVTNGQTADDVAGSMRAALALDLNIGPFFTISGTTNQIILTTRTVAANDPTLNIETDNDGCACGLTPAPTSSPVAPGPPTADDIAGTINTALSASRFNLIGDWDTRGGLTDGTDNNIVGNGGAGTRHITTILNSTLAANGGPTMTHALFINSPAVDQGDDFSVPATTDQRGFPRPINFPALPAGTGDDSDIGAFELQTTAAPPGTPNLDAASDSGINTADDKTNKTTNLTFTITPVIPGATIQLFRDGISVGASGVAGSNSIQLTDPGPLTPYTPAGTTYFYTAKQTLGADTSLASPALPVLVNIIPDAPDLDAASDTGASNTDNNTNDDSPTFTITNIVTGANPVELLRGVRQVETATVAETTPGTLTAGNASVVVTATAMTGSPETVSVTLDTNDNEAAVATKIRAALVADTNVNAFFIVSGVGTAVVLTARTAGADDTFMNVDISDGLCGCGLVAAPTSANTTLGVANAVVASGGPAAGTSVSLTDPGPVPSGTYFYTAQQTVSGPVTSNASAGLSVTIQTSPDAPDLIAASDSGLSSTDNITNVLNPTFNITGVLVGANVELLRDNVSIANNPSAGSTSIQLQDPGATANTVHTYTVRQTPAGGSLSAPSGGLPVTMDTNAPTAGITAVTPDPRNTSVSSIQIVFNEPVAGFDLADLNLNNGGGNLLTGLQTLTSGDNITWTLGNLGGLTGTAGSYSLKVTALSAGITDTAGNTLTLDATDTWVTDTTAPTVSITAVAPDPRNTNVGSILIVFSKAITGFDLADLNLNKGGGNLLTGAQTLISGDNITWTLGNLGGLTGAEGTYTLKLTALGAGINDAAGNALTTDATDTWVVDTTAPTVSITAVAPDPRNTSVSSIQIVFNEAINGFNLADLTLKRDAGADLLPGTATLTSSDNVTWTLGNLDTLTGTTGTYVLKLTAAGAGISDTATNALTTDATETWDVDSTAPTVTVVKEASQADPAIGPTASTVINFTVTFNESVTGFSSTGVHFDNSAGSANPTTASVAEDLSSNHKIYNVAVQGMNRSGFVRIDILASAATDGAGNGNTASGTATVNFIVNNFEVNSLADTNDGSCDPLAAGNCTLREAINAANATPVTETITFDPALTSGGAATITLSTALPDITTDMTIQGPGANLLTVMRSTLVGTPRFRIFTANSSAVTISGLTINNGFTADGANNVGGTGGAGSAGGGILSAGTLTLTNVTVSGNQTGIGGNGMFGGVGGAGGGISNSGTLTITGSTISGNQTGHGGDGNPPSGTGGSGGGIFNTGTLRVSNSTISGNQTGLGGNNGSRGNGGGIYTDIGTVTVTGSTITLNSAGTGRGGGIDSEGGTVTVRNTIVGGGNTATTGPDINGTVQSDGFNLIQSTSSATINLNPGSSPNITGQDPLLNALADNGGPTKTHSLNCTSPVIDNGSAALTTLNEALGINDTQTIFNVRSAAGIPAGVGFVIVIDSEQMVVTGKATNTLTVTRGANGSMAASHANGTSVYPSTLSDQRGLSRPFDLADSVYANAIGGDGSDIGAYETQTGGGCIPTAVAPSPQPSTNEDTLVTITLTGTYSQNTTLGFVISQQPAHGSSLVPSALTCTNTAPNNCTATVDYTPSLDFNGLDSFKFKVTAGALDSEEADVNITVIEVNDPPVANGDVLSDVAEDSGTRTIPFADLLANDSAGPPNENTQALTIISVMNPVGGTVNIVGTDVLFTSAANYFGPASFQYKIRDNGTTNGAPAPKDSVAAATLSFNITPVADQPLVTPATTNENTQTTSGLVITRNGADGAEVTNYKITNITNGTLFQNNGTTPINNGDFITVAQGGLGLKFTPAPNLSSPSSTFGFLIQASLSNADAGLGGGIAPATITVITATTTSVTSSVNPLDFGQSVTFTATVTANTGTPVGTVQFKDNGTNLGAPQTLNASGVATIATSALTVGTHAITADYSGNANFQSSTGTLSGGQVVKPQPSLSINDVSTTEGDSGTKTLNFTVTLSAASNLTVTVNYATANGTASAPSDYTAISSTLLTFNPGQTTRPISVTVNGDQSFEPDETFFVNLSGATNATIADNQGLGTVLNDDAQGGIISFSSGNYTVAEDGKFVTITVNRTGDTSAAATVDYATSDDSNPALMVSCAAVNGIATSRCDFTTAAGRLKFAAGDTSKTFKVLISQDSYVENSETFPITLSNLTDGAVFGAPSITTMTITDDVPEPATNPIDDADNFVREHYHDFLNREGDPGGQAFWTARITVCGTDAACIQRQRIGTSAQFFIEQEFQQTGFYVYRTYKGALGRRPTYVEFMTDRSLLQANPNLDAEKVAYTLEFVQRPEFTGKYAAATTATTFVDALIQNVQTNSGVNLTPRRDELLAAYNAGSDQTDSRARTLRTLVDHADFMAAEYNRGFVLAQYFSYLRREPDATGFNFWLNLLNSNLSNFRVMVCNFITSAEYQDRFGAVRTHNNSECSGSPIAEPDVP